MPLLKGNLTPRLEFLNFLKGNLTPRLEFLNFPIKIKTIFTLYLLKFPQTPH